MEKNKKYNKVLEVCGVLGIAFFLLWPIGFVLYKYYEKKEQKILLLSQKVLNVVGWFNLILGIFMANSESIIFITLIMFVIGYIQVRKSALNEADIKLSQEKLPFLGYGLWLFALGICMLSVAEGGSILGCLFYILGGLFILILANQLKVKEIKFREYLTCVMDQGITSIMELSLVFQNNPADVVEVLTEMIQAQYFGNAYIDQIKQTIVFPHREFANRGSQKFANGTHSEKTEIVVCKNCGGNNTIVIGQVCECEFCGSPISKK